MMDILYFIPKTNLGDKLNAAMIHPIEVIKNICKNNRVHVICQKKFLYPSKNLRFYELKVNIPHIGNILLSYFGFIMALIISRKMDVIYIRNDYFFGASYFLSLFTKKQKIIEINGILEDEIGNKKTILTLLEFYFNARACRLASKIVVVTAKIGKELTKMYNINPQKIVVIENGANTELFRPINKGDVKCGLDENYYYVGFSGSFNVWHGLDDLVKSAPLILKEVENTKFLLVGDGPMKEQVVQMINDLNIADNFIFINRVPYEEVPKYVNAFDVCIILKKKDIPGSPLKLWEYMACGKPVIATNTEDFKALEEYNAGILVDPEKPEDVADAIVTLLKNKELIDEMGKNGRKYVVENRSWEAVAKAVERVMFIFIP